MKTLLVILSVFALSGCALLVRTQHELDHIKLEPIESPIVKVGEIKLGRFNGQTVITGFVYKQSWESITTKTHLDVTLFGANNTVLRQSMAGFTPSQIGNGHRTRGHASYWVIVDPLPADVRRIEVRAHEGAHGTGG